MVEQEGEMDAVITREDVDREKAKLAELKQVADEKKKLVDNDKESKAESAVVSKAAKDQAKIVKGMSRKLTSNKNRRFYENKN